MLSSERDVTLTYYRHECYKQPRHNVTAQSRWSKRPLEYGDWCRLIALTPPLAFVVPDIVTLIEQWQPILETDALLLTGLMLFFMKPLMG
jgi:hypothetical protein